FVTNGKWRNFPNDDARARDNFLRRITFAHQPAEIIAGSERFAQKMECFCLERLEQFVRHEAHVLKHAGTMPADYGSIVGSGLADVKFLRHKSKRSVAATTLASKDGSESGDCWLVGRESADSTRMDASFLLAGNGERDARPSP